MTFKRVVYTGEQSPLVEVTTSSLSYTSLEPQDDQLLVRVEANALNPTDFKHFLVKWGDKGCTVGSDLCGEVIKVGAGNSGPKFEVGDIVGTFVHGGYKYERESGAFQEYVIIPKSTSLKYSKDLKHAVGDHIDSEFGVSTFEAGASFPLSVLTVGMSFESMKLSKADSNDWVLIWGGTTSAGFLAIQVAKVVYGLKVITVANKNKYGAMLEELGADAVIDYNETEVVKLIKKSTDDNVRYALDTVSSEETFNCSYKALRSNGESYLDNLLLLAPSIIRNLDDNKNVSYFTTLLYLVLGTQQNLNGLILDTSDEIVNNHLKFRDVINKVINDKRIKHLPLIIFDGFENADKGLSLLSKKKVSCEKLILRIQKF